MGNFLSDLLHLRDLKKLPQEYSKGIELHRLIDTYTDNHPNVRHVNSALHPYVGKYAPVASDVIFDYFLAKNWINYSSVDFNNFRRMVYEIVNKHAFVFPLNRLSLVNAMIKDDFLLKYTSIEGLEFVFEKMNKRARFDVDFLQALDFVEKDSKFINDQFNIFYPDMINQVNLFCSS